jgi:multicomponent Na+:H+ antiporter subunit C
MLLETAILAGLLFGFATYLVLQPSFVKILFGFILLSNAANLVVLSVSGDPTGKHAPVLSPGGGPYADPLPQALVLTAIVIGFGLLSYLVVLLYRIFLDQRTANAAELFGETPNESKEGKR